MTTSRGSEAAAWGRAGTLEIEVGRAAAATRKLEIEATKPSFQSEDRGTTMPTGITASDKRMPRGTISTGVAAHWTGQRRLASPGRAEAGVGFGWHGVAGQAHGSPRTSAWDVCE